MGEIDGKTDIRTLDLQDLKLRLSDLGEKTFRANQVYQWIWNKSATSFEEMTNISKQLRESLEKSFEFRPIRIDHFQQSADKTIKIAFKLFDGHTIEGVLIPAKNRMTACISSQVGCSLSCRFCATGYLEKQRNLSPAEIYDQVVLIAGLASEYFNASLTNVVFMGMGEPLLNYKNVLDAISHIASPEGLGMASRRITLSTAGIAKMIKKLGEEEVKFSLALSLHAANDEKRNRIMPINQSNSINSLIEALEFFYGKTKSQITYEYIIFDKINDTLQDASELYQLTKKFPVKINLIEYNPIDQADFKNPQEDKLTNFRDYLEKRGVNVKLRRSRGKDIDAACGQLANKRS